MSENSHIRDLEQRIIALERYLFPGKMKGDASGHASSGHTAIIVNNLPQEINHKQVREQVFSHYTKSIMFAESLGKGVWRITFNDGSVANQCIARYRDAKVNGVKIHCQLDKGDAGNYRNSQPKNKKFNQRRFNTSTE